MKFKLITPQYTVIIKGAFQVVEEFIANLKQFDVSRLVSSSDLITWCMKMDKGDSYRIDSYSVERV